MRMHDDMPEQTRDKVEKPAPEPEEEGDDSDAPQRDPAGSDTEPLPKIELPPTVGIGPEFVGHVEMAEEMMTRSITE